MARNPFEEIERMFDRMSRQFEDIEADALGESLAVDIAEGDDAYVVTADLPGFEADDIDLELSGDRLTVSAEHTEEGEEGDHEYLRRERRRESVSRTVRLPGAVDEAAAEAEHEDGVLTVTLPKQAPGTDGRNIPIE